MHEWEALRKFTQHKFNFLSLLSPYKWPYIWIWVYLVITYKTPISGVFLGPYLFHCFFLGPSCYVMFTLIMQSSYHIVLGGWVAVQPWRVTIIYSNFYAVVVISQLPTRQPFHREPNSLPQLQDPQSPKATDWGAVLRGDFFFWSAKHATLSVA